MKYCKELMDTFTDANDPEYHRQKYCAINCDKCANHDLLKANVHIGLTDGGQKYYVMPDKGR